MRAEGIVLAAGMSRRMGGGLTKILMPFRDGTVLSTLLGAISRSGLDRVIIVTGFQHECVSVHIERDIAPLFNAIEKELVVVENKKYLDGMAVSFRAGAARVSPGTDAILLFLGDQPSVLPETIDMLAQEFEEQNNSGKRYVLAHPRFRGKKGHPVLFSTVLLDEVLSFTARDQVRFLTYKYRERALLLDVDDEGVVLDVDTPGDLERFRDMSRS